MALLLRGLQEGHDWSRIGGWCCPPALLAGASHGCL